MRWKTCAPQRRASGPVHCTPYFTDHTLEHSQRIIALLDGLTAGMMRTEKRLSPTEIFVLLIAAYLHDIGMQNERFAGGNLEEIRADHHEQTAEMIYAVFEDPANAFPIPLAGDPGPVEAVALVAKGHRRVDPHPRPLSPMGRGEVDLNAAGVRSARPRQRDAAPAAAGGAAPLRRRAGH